MEPPYNRMVQGEHSCLTQRFECTNQIPVKKQIQVVAEMLRNVLVTSKKTDYVPLFR